MFFLEIKQKKKIYDVCFWWKINAKVQFLNDKGVLFV